MSMLDRAAQFSPFAALTGYDAAIRETGRRTEQRIELDEDAKAVLSDRLRLLHAHLEESPTVQITYFVPDACKEGGAYVTVTGCVRVIDLHRRVLRMADGSAIPMGELLRIEGELFRTDSDF